MKAAVVEQPGVVVVREVPEPVMGDYDCLCEGLYGATCSGTDLHLIAGHPLFGVQFPTMLGHESIGRVMAVGKKVESFQVGDVVTRMSNQANEGLQCHWGGYAERGLVSDWRVLQREGLSPKLTPGINHVLPPEMDPAGATMIITWRETFSFITRIGVHPGDRVLVLGSGGNGLALANHAANLLAGVICVSGSPAREANARTVGATHFLDYRSEDLVAAAREHELGDFDVILDAVGKVGQLDRVLPLLRRGGKLSTYGVDDWGQISINPQRAPGTFTYCSEHYLEGEVHDTVLGLMQRGLLRPQPCLALDRVFPLADINEALEAVRRREVIKAVVKLAEVAS